MEKVWAVYYSATGNTDKTVNTIAEELAAKLGLPLERFFVNIGEYGNTSAASIPLVLSELQEQGKVGPGSRVLAVGFGGGLTWGGALIEFV